MSPSDPHAKRPSEQVDLSSLFTRRFKHTGRDILRPLWFYISLNKNGYAATKRLIISHGGKVSTDLGDGKTSKEICLIDPHAKGSRDGRPAYSVDYIQSCIAAKRLLNLEDFRIAAVARTRRTPSKKNRPPSEQDRPTENIRKQTEEREIPDLTQAKDSEVTDDLPCIEFPQADLETREPPNANGQMKTAVLPDRTLTPDAGGTNPRTTPNDKDPSKAQGITPSRRPELTRPQFVTPKKRRSPDWGMAAVENDGGNNTQKDTPQAVLPINDSVNWTKEEDNAITQLCVETKDVYHSTERDPNMIFTLECWLKLEKADMLPTGRSASACFARAKQLWKNGETESPDLPEETHANRAPVSHPQPGSPGSPERQDKIRETRNPSQLHVSPRGVCENHETGQEKPAALRNASRRETREYIIELVGRISKRGKVSKRSAFRALRQERGHWKRALQLVTRRKRRSNA